MFWYDDNSYRDPTSRRVVDFLMDSVEDLSDLPGINKRGTPQPDDSTVHLPVEKGSTALCISDASLYILNSQNQWIKSV